MPKIYCPSRTPATTTEDLTGSFYTKIESDNRFVHLFGDEIINGVKTFNSNVYINSNLGVGGAISENLRIEDNIITLNYGEVADGITFGSAGIEIDRGSANDGFLVLVENLTGNNTDNRWMLDIGDGNMKKVIYDDFPDTTTLLGEVRIGSNSSSGYLLNIEGGAGDQSLLQMRRQNALGGGFQFETSSANVSLFFTTDTYSRRAHISGRNNEDVLRIGTGSSPSNTSSAIYIDSSNHVRINNELIVEDYSTFNDIVNINYSGTLNGTLNVTNTSTVDHSIIRIVGDKSEILDVRNKDFNHYFSWNGDNDFVFGKDTNKFRFARGTSWPGFHLIWEVDNDNNFIFGTDYLVKVQNDLFITSLTPSNSGNFLTFDGAGKIIDCGFGSEFLDSEYVNISGDTMEGYLSMVKGLVGYNNITHSTFGNNQIVDQIKDDIGDAVRWDLKVKKGLNIRMSQVMAVWDGTNVEFTEISTNDLGDTSSVEISAGYFNGDIVLTATTDTSGWEFNSLRTIL